MTMQANKKRAPKAPESFFGEVRGTGGFLCKQCLLRHVHRRKTSKGVKGGPRDLRWEHRNTDFGHPRHGGGELRLEVYPRHRGRYGYGYGYG